MLEPLPVGPPTRAGLPRLLAGLCLLLLVLVTLPALAQVLPPSAGGAASAGMPTLSAGLAVTMTLSLLAGVITQAVQSGKILGQATTPAGWLPWLTTLGSFLAGIVGYLQGLPAGFDITGPVAFFALAAGIVHLETANVAARAVHAHVILPATVRAMRAAGGGAGKVDAVTKAAAGLSSGLLMLLVLGALLLGCQNPAGTISKVAPPAAPAVECVVSDAVKGDSLSQIVSDCGGDVSQVIAILVDPATYQKVSPTAAYAEAGRVKLALARTP